ncbi:MAG: hypothetical protein HC820_01745 [Hydrococcus sp. RM1_1_31]|nr:hypothetical protein [Hydrococcus sp. RM1_1_31]
MLETRTNKKSSQLKFFQANETEIPALLAQFQDLAWRIIAFQKRNNSYLPPQLVEELKQLVNSD